MDSNDVSQLTKNALNNVIASIALQEAGLAHVLNAQSEIMSSTVSLLDPTKMEGKSSASVTTALSVSESIRRLAETATLMETNMRSKLCCALSFVALEDAIEL